LLIQMRWIRRELGYGGLPAFALGLWLYLLAAFAGTGLGLLILRS
jgi:hypothetical protein